MDDLLVTKVWTTSENPWTSSVAYSIARLLKVVLLDWGAVADLAIKDLIWPETKIKQRIPWHCEPLVWQGFCIGILLQILEKDFWCPLFRQCRLLLSWCQPLENLGRRAIRLLFSGSDGVGYQWTCLRWHPTLHRLTWSARSGPPSKLTGGPERSDRVKGAWDKNQSLSNPQK